MKEKNAILIRLDKDEFERITALAQATVLSREEFIRQALRGTTIRASPPAEYVEILREMRRMGNNVHQLLIKARTLEFVDEIMLQETVDMIRHMDRVFTEAFV
ncbi:MAG: ribbon-helix-helix protein, CopG family [Clostridia bacterium]|nr:ribbon-helix-helix protein, CopG family [Clostridia bacterium]